MIALKLGQSIMSNRIDYRDRLLLDFQIFYNFPWFSPLTFFCKRERLSTRAVSEDIDNDKLINEIEYNGKVIWDPKDENHHRREALTAAWNVIVKAFGPEPTEKKERTKKSE